VPGAGATVSAMTRPTKEQAYENAMRVLGRYYAERAASQRPARPTKEQTRPTKEQAYAERAASQRPTRPTKEQAIDAFLSEIAKFYVERAFREATHSSSSGASTTDEGS
jgi:hypothetical protein